MKRAPKKFFTEMLATGRGSRAVASMYSWGGGVGQTFRMTKNVSDHLMAYEATKVFEVYEDAIYKQKYAYLRTDALQKRVVP
jgi:hypothetical protein